MALFFQVLSLSLFSIVKYQLSTQEFFYPAIFQSNINHPALSSSMLSSFYA